MIWIALIAGLFLLLLLFPILLAVYWYYHGKDSVLPVRQDRRRDPRYFANSFDSIFCKAWETRKDGTILMSRPEQYLLADDLTPSEYAASCNVLVVAENKNLTPPAVHFLREIYAYRNAHFIGETHLRGIRTCGDLLLGSGVILHRWADADGTVAVYDNCDLGMSVTAGKGVSVGKNCTFRRLFAPVLYLGAYPGCLPPKNEGKKKYVYQPAKNRTTHIHQRHISRSDVDETGMVCSSLITSGDIIIDEKLTVQGSIRSAKGIRLAEGATVYGDLFADGDIYLSRNCTVLGNVFTQSDVYCETGVVIGQENRTISLIARGHIVIEENCLVYGYISNEAGGIICPINKLDRRIEPQEEQYLQIPQSEDIISFSSRKDFELIDDQGFRHNPLLKKVSVPDGVKVIPDSMFFDCSALETIILPPSLEKIGKYAFADCTGLKRLDLHHLTNLRLIDRSAFDGCSMLEEVLLPNNLKTLGSTAFCNCIRLRSCSTEQGLLPENIGDRCFLNCPFDPNVQNGSPPVVGDTSLKGDVMVHE
jgi:hypothetical protein